MNTKDETCDKPTEEVIKRCSDYDEDCKDINAAECFLGGVWTCRNGYTQYVPMADGYCPEMDKQR